MSCRMNCGSQYKRADQYNGIIIRNQFKSIRAYQQQQASDHKKPIMQNVLNDKIGEKVSEYDTDVANQFKIVEKKIVDNQSKIGKIGQ